MKQLKPTLLAAAISAAVASTATYSTPFNASIGYQNQTINKQSLNADAAFQLALANEPTASGMKSQFDAAMGKATFVWAPANMTAPKLANLAKHEQPAAAANHYLNQLMGASINKSGSQVSIASMHNQGKGAMIAKYRQEVSGVEVFNREYNIMMDREYNLVASSGFLATNFTNEGQIAPSQNFGSPESAIQQAFHEMTGGMDVELSFIEDAGKYQMFSATSLDSNKLVAINPRVKRVYFETEAGLTPAFYVEVSASESNSTDSDYFSYVIDANAGKVLFRNNLVVSDSNFSYRVFANEDFVPNHGPNGDVTPQLTPGNDPTAIVEQRLLTLSSFPGFSQQDPWLADGATETSGNNAVAYADVIPPDGFTNGDITAETTADQTFDYVLDLDNEKVISLNNRKSSIVNLFYMNNYLHDYYYDFGFDEASGNAQLDNYGRGGVEGDPLRVEAQDNSGLNNANMATPADGVSPRMQQFLWNDKDATVGEDYGVRVTDPVDIGVLTSSQLATFGPSQFSLSGNLVRIDDGNDVDTSSVTDGCEAAVNAEALAGNIAVIDRGSCNFTVKVLNAQNAGAIGAIVVNNVDDGTPAPMGGTDDNVTIGSMGLNFAEGNQLYDLIDAGTPVAVDLFSNFPLRDSTLDNAVVAHEFGHYIQNRLVGNGSGLFNFQGRAMGEGWADIHAMLFVTSEEDLSLPGNEEMGVGYAVGSYVADFFRGIRRAPYSSDMTINPLTFEHIQADAVPPGLAPTSVASPHAPGEVWAVALWDLYVSLVNTYGFDEGRSRMTAYVIEGYKLTPVTPTYIEARDAVLAAALARDAVDFDLAVAAFAKRGMGFGAIAPARFDTNLIGPVQSFETQLATFNASAATLNADFDGESLGFCTADGVLDAGETGTLTLSITNGGSEALSGVTAQVTVVTGQDVTLENDGLVTFDNLGLFETATSAPMQVTLNSAATADLLAFEVSFPEQVEGDDIAEAPAFFVTSTVNLDFEPRQPVANADTADMETVALFEDFQQRVLSAGANADNTQRIDSVNTGFFNSFVPTENLGRQTMLIGNNGFPSDVVVETQPVEVGFGGDFTISFFNAYLLETGFDGGVVEVSVNGDEWVDVTALGGQFAFGYNAVLGDVGTALSNRPVFTGRNLAPDFSALPGALETINFGSRLNGNEVAFRFRVVTDANTSDFGWFIDNVTFTNINTPVYNGIVAGDTAACDNALPKVTVSDDVSISEDETATLSASATDRNGDTLSYSWTQTAGPEASITGADTPEVTIDPPSITADATLVFEVAVSDGMDTAAETVTVNVSNVNPPPPPPAPEPQRSSGGGSAGWLALLTLPLIYLRRRKR